MTLKEGYILDFISGKEIKAGPEEIDAVQPFSKLLVDDYGYDKSQIITRPQWKVRGKPSDTHGVYPVDIAVFKDNNINDENLYIIVECKKKNRKDGQEQLQDYLKFSQAEIGIWFNGSDSPLFIRKIIKKGGVYFDEIPAIPRKGERLEDLGQFRRKDLKPAHNLKTVFKIIRNHLAGNAVGTTRDEELAKQLINIVFTKIYDEKFKKPEELVDFRAGIDEKPSEVKARIGEIFTLVKTKYKEVIDVHDDINLDPESLYYVVGQLQNYCLTDAERDVIADAFETFIGYALKGPQGQFFTPRNVVKLMVEVIAQQPDELIIDPACGSGGFLVESLKHIWKELDNQATSYGWSESALSEEKIAAAITNICGLEKDLFLSKVAKAYMAILGDGKGGIFCQNTLDKPSTWERKTQQRIKLDSFDCLLANPPFGKDIKITGRERLQQYDLAYKHKKEDGKYKKTQSLYSEMPPQILFIERSMQLLRDGGRMGIILPETFFHAPRSQHVMQFMAKHNIYCLIDLPHNTFRPHNNAKCVAVFLEKNTPQTDKILMCVAEEMGHDHQGKPIYRWDYKNHKRTSEIWDDFPKIQEEIHNEKPEKYSFYVNSKDVAKSQIYVPRYYWQQKEQEISAAAQAEGLTLVPIQQLINEKIIQFFDGHGSPSSENKGKGEIPYIRVKDIVNWEIYKDPTSLIPETVYQSMLSSKKKLKPKDIVYVRRGSYRIGSVAMVSPYDTEVLLTREILVLRLLKEDNKYNINAYYLLYLLSHWITHEQAKNKILIETTLPNIGDRWSELALPIHNDKKVIAKISQKIEEAIRQKWLAMDSINNLRQEFGNITT